MQMGALARKQHLVLCWKHIAFRLTKKLPGNNQTRVGNCGHPAPKGLQNAPEPTGTSGRAVPALPQERALLPPRRFSSLRVPPSSTPAGALPLCAPTRPVASIAWAWPVLCKPPRSQSCSCCRQESTPGCSSAWTSPVSPARSRVRQLHLECPKEKIAETMETHPLNNLQTADRCGQQLRQQLASPHLPPRPAPSVTNHPAFKLRSPVGAGADALSPRGELRRCSTALTAVESFAAQCFCAWWVSAAARY